MTGADLARAIDRHVTRDDRHDAAGACAAPSCGEDFTGTGNLCEVCRERYARIGAREWPDVGELDRRWYNATDDALEAL